MWQRFKKTLLVVGFSTAGLCSSFYFLTPVPQSEPLVDRSGIRVDSHVEAKLVQLVFAAAREDDASTVRAFLDEGFTPNVRSERGDPLLTVAVYAGSQEVVKLLLADQRTDLEAVNRMGLTAVAAAAFKGHEDCLAKLLERGADPNASNAVGQTALMFASLAGRTGTIQMLKDAGAAVNRKDQAGNSAIDIAKSQQASSAVQVLTDDWGAYRSDAPVPLELR